MVVALGLSYTSKDLQPDSVMRLSLTCTVSLLGEVILISGRSWCRFVHLQHRSDCNLNKNNTLNSLAHSLLIYECRSDETFTLFDILEHIAKRN